MINNKTISIVVVNEFDYLIKKINLELYFINCNSNYKIPNIKNIVFFFILL